jgi:hypothetical protein
MLFTHTTFIGIDPTAGQKPFTYIALDNDLRLLAIGQGHMNDVLAFTAGQRQAAVAVCAPRLPNRGLMARAEVRQQLIPAPRPGRWTNFRVAEYQLRQHNISCPQTYAQEESCSRWMQTGFALYRGLDSIGYRPFPCPEQPLVSIEVYPHACYTALLGRVPLPKSSLEGRIQRQLILEENDVHVSDPMRLFEEITRHRLLQGLLPLEHLHQPSELDALVAAYTAWLAVCHPEQTTLLGEVEDGQIVVPVAELKRTYR